MVNLQLERVHWRVEVYAVQVAHEEDLRVALASVAGFGAFRWAAALDYDDVGDDVAFEFVEARVDFAVVELLGALRARA